MSSEISPYDIAVPQRRLDLLHKKLALSIEDLPNELEDADWDHGVPLPTIRHLLKKWQAYDWRATEASLNSLPSFHTSIPVNNFGPLDIHFVHQPSPREDAIPLLFVHGWPGSFLEAIPVLPGLTDPKDRNKPAFHVVAPSLPNFGFSEGPLKRGFGLQQYAETLHKLMRRLGYDRYATQAGDWGFWITRRIALDYPAHCRASHYNMIWAREPPGWDQARYERELSARELASEKRAQERMAWFQATGRGYNTVQSTKPQTIAYALHDSPAACLAWIYEKMRDWSDGHQWTDEEILTWVSVYWFSRMGPGAAGRIYYEVMHPGGTGASTLDAYYETLEPLEDLKIGLAFNPKELEIFPKPWGRRLGHVVYEVDNEHGG